MRFEAWPAVWLLALLPALGLLYAYGFRRRRQALAAFVEQGLAQKLLPLGPRAGGLAGRALPAGCCRLPRGRPDAAALGPGGAPLAAARARRHRPARRLLQHARRGRAAEPARARQGRDRRPGRRRPAGGRPSARPRGLRGRRRRALPFDPRLRSVPEAPRRRLGGRRDPPGHRDRARRSRPPCTASASWRPATPI